MYIVHNLLYIFRSAALYCRASLSRHCIVTPTGVRQKFKPDETRAPLCIPPLSFGPCPVLVLCIIVAYPVLILHSFCIHQFLTVCPLANPLSILSVRLLSCINPLNILLMSGQDPVNIRFYSLHVRY